MSNLYKDLEDALNSDDDITVISMPKLEVVAKQPNTSNIQGSYTNNSIDTQCLTTMSYKDDNGSKVELISLVFIAGLDITKQVVHTILKTVTMTLSVILKAAR